jgi:TonB family protein
MAEAIALRDAADTIEPFSGGLAPLGYVAEITEQTLMRNGYWVEGLESKGILPEVWNQADRVINMSGRPRELAFPDYSKVEDWEIEDPFGKDPKICQQTFEKIWQRVTLLRMRIQFPEPGNWVETSGQIERRSESKKEAGARVADLTAETQQQIRDRIWAQISEAESHPERETFPTLLNQQDALGGVDLQTEKSFSVEDAMARATAQPLIQSMNASTQSQTSQDRILEADTKLTTPQEQLVSGDLDRGGIPQPISNRRVHFRKRVVPPGYISLEDDNGGIVLNVSEGGLSLAAAIALTDADSLNMRFQVPHCRGLIEAKGQITWRSESGKIAGVRFVALSGEAQGQIRKWIHLEVPPSHRQKQPEKIRQARNLRAASLIPGSRSRSGANQEDRPAAPFSPDSVSSLQGAKGPVTAPGAPTPAGIAPAKRVLKARLWARDIGVLGRKWRRIGTVVGLIVLITLTAGRIARNLNAGNKMIVSVAQQPEVASGASKSEAPPLERRIAEAPAPGVEKMNLQPQKGESVPAEKHENSYAPPRNLPRQVRRVEHSSPPAIVNHPKLTPGKAAAPVQGTKEPTRAAANVNSPPAQTSKSQQVGSLPAPPPQPGVNIAIASGVSSPPGPPKDPSPVEPKKKESTPPSPKLLESPTNMTGLVAIHTGPYPSLRMPNERSSKKSSQGKSLQFGHLVSRVEPAYPEEAKQRGIEGTVKLHAVFGRDGAVESLSPISGPPVLMAAAMNAVRAWHYSQTLLDNKSIEIEEDISVEFRLSNSAAARN